ncbi:MAG: hypothetical protein ACLTWW_09900, partial [Negativibacillus sp.]
FIIACCFEFVKLFFQDFLNRFGSASRNFPDWLTVWVPIGPLWCAALRQLNYNTTPLPFCQHLFTLFLTFFEKSGFFPFSSLFPAILRPPIPTLPPLYFFAPFCYNV